LAEKKKANDLAKATALKDKLAAEAAERESKVSRAKKLMEKAKEEMDAIQEDLYYFTSEAEFLDQETEKDLYAKNQNEIRKFTIKVGEASNKFQKYDADYQRIKTNVEYTEKLIKA
jgi:hypothetical protein